MKLVSFRHRAGESYGVVSGDAVVDIGARHAARWPTLAAFIGGGGIAEVGATLAARAGDHALNELALLPPIPEPRKTFGIGLNYRSHLAESGREMPKYPILFIRFPDSVVGHGEAILVPRASDELDYEGEMAVVIGRRAHHVKVADAFDYVAGYSCYNEGSVRDFQRHTIQFSAGKTFWRSGSFGPWLVTPDEAPDPDDMTLVTRLNGQVMQEAEVSDLLFKVPELIAYITTICPLDPGDVIITGTTGGVGFLRDPPVFLKAGDTVEVELGGVGVLSNPVEKER